jgi:hypothetical protein
VQHIAIIYGTRLQFCEAKRRKNYVELLKAAFRVLKDQGLVNSFVADADGSCVEGRMWTVWTRLPLGQWRWTHHRQEHFVKASKTTAGSKAYREEGSSGKRGGSGGRIRIRVLVLIEL